MTPTNAAQEGKNADYVIRNIVEDAIFEGSELGNYDSELAAHSVMKALATAGYVVVQRALLEDCINDFADASQYKGDYLRKKHGDDEAILKYREAMRQGGGGERSETRRNEVKPTATSSELL